MNSYYEQGFSSVLPYRFDAGKGKPCGKGYIPSGKKCRVGEGGGLRSPAEGTPAFKKYTAKELKKYYNFTTEDIDSDIEKIIENRSGENSKYVKNRPKGYYTSESYGDGWSPQDEEETVLALLGRAESEGRKRLSNKDIDYIQKKRNKFVEIELNRKPGRSAGLLEMAGMIGAAGVLSVGSKVLADKLSEQQEKRKLRGR